MKTHLAKLSLALLSTVFLLGCQEQGSGPVVPEGPQFDKPGTGTCDAAASGGHCHGDDDAETFLVTVTSASGHISSDPLQDAKLASGGNIVANDFTLDLKDFFKFKLTCGGTTLPITGPQEGSFVLLETSSDRGVDYFASLRFTHNGIKHGLHLDGTITDPDNWPPATGTSNSMTELPNGNGRWIVSAGGKGHKNGCTGEGGGLVDDRGIVYEATVEGL